MLSDTVYPKLNRGTKYFSIPNHSFCILGRDTTSFNSLNNSCASYTLGMFFTLDIQ